jgi:hypothetical protein
MHAQEWVEAAVALSGSASAEEIDQGTLDHYEFLYHHPVRINGSRLSALLTPYQVATVLDYRHRCGDILSPAELALVDGFSPEKVRAMEPFISFESSRKPGDALVDSLRLGVKAIARAELNCIAGKLMVDGGDAVQAGYARRLYFDGRSGGSFFATCNYPGGRFLAGCFNLRYGEGLLFWSGLSMDQTGTTDGFSRRGGGLSPSWSWSGEGTYRGFAGEYSHGVCNAMAFVAENAAGGRISALTRTGSYGLNFKYQDGFAASADVKQRLWGADFFGEAALGVSSAISHANSSVIPSAVEGSHLRWSALGGVRLPLADGLSAALRLQALPSAWTGRKYGEYSAAIGVKYGGGGYVPIAGKTGFGSSERRHSVDAVAQVRLLPIPGSDPRRHELKLTASWGFRPDSLLRLDSRIIVRYKSYEPWRAELRTDALLSDGLVSLKLRLHGAWCNGPGFLAYGEAGYTPGPWQLWFRCTSYHTSAWSSRIYVYERDIPGSFSVPACYGIGQSLSLLASHTLRLRRFRLKSALRAGVAFKDKAIPTLKFQLTAEL